MEIIQQIANDAPPPMGFLCEICGDFQELSNTHIWGKEIIFPVCDQCKADLKTIILNKRKNGEE